MNEAAMLYNSLLVGGLLFVIGMIGLLVRRNMIVMFMCAEMMLQGIAMSFIAWGRFHQDWGGQMMVIFMITVAACEAAIALALILMLYHKSGKLDIAFWQDMREEGQPAFVDREVPEEIEEDPVWPTLTEAGHEPVKDEDALLHRSRV